MVSLFKSSFGGVIECCFFPRNNHELAFSWVEYEMIFVRPLSNSVDVFLDCNKVFLLRDYTVEEHIVSKQLHFSIQNLLSGFAQRIGHTILLFSFHSRSKETIHATLYKTVNNYILYQFSFFYSVCVTQTLGC